MAPLFLPGGDVPVRGETAGPLGHRHLKLISMATYKVFI